MLRVGSDAWTKDDILKLIGALRPAKERMFHKWIESHPALLGLLEWGQVPEEGPRYEPWLVAEPAFESFQDFIAPYLVESIGRGMNQSFVQRDFARVRRFLEVATLLVPTRAEEILARLAHLLDDQAQALERVESDKAPFDREWFGYITPDFIALLNGLPESHASLREWLSLCLVNLLAKKATVLNFSSNAYNCMLELRCAPPIRSVLISSYRTFKRLRYVLLASKVLGILVGLCILVYGLIVLVRIDPLNPFYPPGPETRTVLRRAEEEIPTIEETYCSYRNRLRTIVQKQLTPAGADSMRYILLTNPQVNNEHTLWHHAVPGTHLSNYKPTAARMLTIVNGSQYDAVLFVIGDSALYNGFLSRGESLRTSISMRDQVAFYVGNSWQSPGSIKRGVYPWTDVKAQYGIFTKVDTTTLVLLDKTYHLPAGTGKKNARVSLTTGNGGLQLMPDNVLLEKISQKRP